MRRGRRRGRGLIILISFFREGFERRGGSDIRLVGFGLGKAGVIC